MHISPINISVHTTNPDLRIKMMHNKRAGEVLSYMKKLADAGISLCGQIVLCRGINDGEELLRSMRDLSELFPAMTSVSIVPAGLTKFREKLYPLTTYSKEEAREVIEMIDSFANEMIEKCGHRIFFAADELYLKAEMPLPSEEYYEGYSQIENGVGMITSMTDEFNYEFDYIDEYLPEAKLPREVSVVTGVAAYDSLLAMTKRLEERVPGLKINVYKIINHFFGESITVAGLLTGKDISEQLQGKDLGEVLFFPENMLRAGEDIFLDDMTPAELSEKLGVRAIPGSNDGACFVRNLLFD
jgi:putative radical SAM enzyme (TIGR03279 family)